MDIFLIFLLSVLQSLVIGSSASVTAYFDNGGVKGTVIIESANNDLDATFKLSGTTVADGTFTVEVRKFPLNKDSGDWCNVAELGDRFLLIGSSVSVDTLKSGTKKVSSTTVNITGEGSILGRTLLITKEGGNGQKVCALIGVEGLETYLGPFYTSIYGSIYFQTTKVETGKKPFYIYAKLASADEEYSGKSLSFALYKTKFRQRIFSANYGTKDVCDFNQENKDNIVSQEIFLEGNVLIGNKDYGQTFVSGEKEFGSFSTFNELTLHIKNSTGDDIVCTQLFKAIERQLTYQTPEVEIKFIQPSPLSQTGVSIRGRNTLVGSAKLTEVDIMTLPAEERLYQSDSRCDVNELGGVFQPFTPATESLKTGDAYPVGNVLKESDSRTTQKHHTAFYLDNYITLYGRFSIIGRALRLKVNSKTVCLNGIYTGINRVQTYTFKPPIIGQIIFTQIGDPNYFSETLINIKLAYQNGTVTTGNELQIQQMKYFISPKYNLSHDNCKVGDHFSCHLGDLTGKHGKIDIGVKKGMKRYIFHDIAWSRFKINGALELKDSAGNLIGKSYGNGKVVQAGSGIISDEYGTKFLYMSQWTPYFAMKSSFEVETKKVEAKTYISGDTDGVVYNEFNTQPPVGDLSQRYGSSSIGGKIRASTFDPELTLFGQNSIIGRYLVSKKVSGNDILGKAMITPVSGFVNKFESSSIIKKSLNGKIYFYLTDIPDQVTIVIEDMQTINTISNTNGIKFDWFISVTDQPIGSSCPTDIFNPYSLNQTDPDSLCSFRYPQGCIVGDLTAKHGKLLITSEKKNLVFTDLNLEESLSARGHLNLVLTSEDGTYKDCFEMIDTGSGTQPDTYLRSTGNVFYYFSSRQGIDSSSYSFSHTQCGICSEVTINPRGMDGYLLKLTINSYLDDPGFIHYIGKSGLKNCPDCKRRTPIVVTPRPDGPDGSIGKGNSLFKLKDIITVILISILSSWCLRIR